MSRSPALSEPKAERGDRRIEAPPGAQRVRLREALLAVSDGAFGTRAVSESVPADGRSDVVEAGDAYGPEPPGALLAAPDWTRLGGDIPDSGRWFLDLAAGTVAHDTGSGRSSLRLASVTRPGTAALRLLGAPAGVGTRIAAPSNPAVPESRIVSGPGSDGSTWMAIATERTAVATAIFDRRTGDVVDRHAGLATGTTIDEAVALALRRLERATALGWDRLLAEQETAWGRRWQDADVDIDGDPWMEDAVRFAVFHLLSNVADDGEAAVGARGLTGPGYLGHVFWDADVFVLPVVAALSPPAARAMLEYRFRRLDAAIAQAAELGREGARFPWESARSGRDVTPHSGVDPTGRTVPIRTAEMEEHIVADVAWATAHYAGWTGDDVLAVGPGRDLLVETARYWASRVEGAADGTFHIRHVIGPDEYHENVDDNTYTNVLARWNLREAAARLTADPSASPDRSDVRLWSHIADRLVDGYDPALGRHHQFAGFDRLEPLFITRLARPPVAADVLLGESVKNAQVIKQADVVMAHHVVPDEMRPGSLAADLDYALPRTAHGSSLSPAIHAAQLARDRRPEEALHWLDIAARIDLEDLTGTTAGGLHLAALAGLWQALVFGFLGVRRRQAALELDPVLPGRWSRVRVTMLFRGSRVTITSTHAECRVDCDRAMAVGVPGGDVRVGETHRFRSSPGGWETL